MNVSTKDLNNYVRLASKNAGWDIWDTYADKRADGTKRIKYMRNGWDPGKIKQKIESAIKAKVSKYDNIVKMGWSEGDSFRGSYPYFYIVVKDVDGNTDPNFGKLVATEEGKAMDTLFSKPLYVYKNHFSDMYQLATDNRSARSLGKSAASEKDAKKLTPKKADFVKQAIGPRRIKSLISKNWTDIPEAVYNKLISA